jgi:surfeit locus 1 family protein
MHPRPRPLLWPAISAAVVFALLCGLGLWQLRRQEWKQALIARIETRARAAPRELPPRSEWPALAQDDYDLLHARAAGRFDLDREALIFTAPPDGFGAEPGYLVIAPFLLADGGAVLVERGFIAGSQRASATRRQTPQGDVTIAGLLRAPQSRNAFTPADEPDKGVFYTSDPGKIAAHLHLANAAPFILALDALEAGAATPADLPRPLPGVPEIVNNHLGYALTWFSLAGGLAIIFALYAYRAAGRDEKR